ncbi:MAG: GumC family protein [Nitrospirales bacterium]
METGNSKQLSGDSTLLIQAYVQDLWDIAVRRKWLIIIIVLLSVLAAGAYAWIQPVIYKSSTTILVEHQKIPENFVRAMVSDRVAERVSTITQQVLSRTSLQRVIEELNLYPEAIKQSGYDPVIASMSRSVQLQTKGSGGRLESFTISFSHTDPLIAMKVTAKIASQYIDENLKIREQFVEGASEFLAQELAIARKELDDKEKVLSEYRMKHLGELPRQMNSNLHSLDRLQAEKVSIQETLNSLRARIELIQKSIHDYESMAGALAELPNFDGQAINSPGPGASPIVKHLAKLQDDLAKMKVEYTDSYPDVITLKNHIKQIEEQIAETQSADPSGEESVGDEFSGEDLSGLSVPTSNFDPYLQDLQNSLSEAKAQIVTLKERRQRIIVKMAEHQRNIDATPTREQELLILERDYANMQQNYQRLHEKQINSRISENLEKRQKAERFRVLDPANLPTMPEGPPRYLIVVAGFIVGLGLGYGLAFVLEQWKPTFRRSEDAEVSIGLPILATIPSFQIAYGKSFKSLPSSSSELGNGHSTMNNPRANYLTAGVPVKHSNGKSKGQMKNGVPRDLGLVAKWRPDSIVAEQYRVAATRLNLLNTNQGSTVVLVTSAMKAEGKTSTVANLAYTLAHDLDEPTLVIDCDFKCPALHEVMSVPIEPGLSEYFQGDEPLEACMHQLADNPLWILPVGNIDVNPVPLSKFPQLATVIDAVKSRFRYILIDSPPILPLADVNVLTRLAEILLFVVRSGSTPKDVVLKATDMLETTAQTRIILTDAWSQGMPYYVRQGYEVPYAIGERG